MSIAFCYKHGTFSGDQCPHCLENKDSFPKSTLYKDVAYDMFYKYFGEISSEQRDVLYSIVDHIVDDFEAITKAKEHKQNTVFSNFIKETKATLDKMSLVQRCESCVHNESHHKDYYLGKCKLILGGYTPSPDWYCADFKGLNTNTSFETWYESNTNQLKVQDRKPKKSTKRFLEDDRFDGNVNTGIYDDDL